MDNIFQTIDSIFVMKKWNKISVKKMPIRVAFIAQMTEIWDKEEAVFEYMKKDSRFDVTILAVPPYDMINKTVTYDYSDNYFLSTYPIHAVKAFQNGKWIDLKDQYDYVFFQRPYDSYLPEQLRSRNVSKYSKCCYIPYGFSGSVNFNEGNTNRRFFRNMYFCFVETQYMANLLKKKFPLSKNLRHFECLGYPALIPYFSMHNKRLYNSVLWTPRWSFDKKIGGSTFLENKDILLKLSNNENKGKLVFRPHPLLFGELISKGIMSQDEIDNYKNKMDSAGIIYDSGTPILKAIEDADILITDFSSIIIQFFLTGKPLIYCDGGLILNEFFMELSDGFYIAHNETEVIKYVELLLSGNDYKYQIRQEIIKKYTDLHISSTEKIVERIVLDTHCNA